MKHVTLFFHGEVDIYIEMRDGVREIKEITASHSKKKEKKWGWTIHCHITALIEY